MSDPVRLIKRTVESLKSDPQKETLVWDSELKGFGVRVFPTGRKTYFVQYRNQYGGTRRKKIGVHGIVTADLAREEAKKLLGDVAKGHDPSVEAQKAKLKPSLDELAREYLEVYAKANKRPKSYLEDEKMLQNIVLKRWKGKKLEEISSHDVQQLHYELRETPYMANRVRALLSKMFNLAIQWSWVSSNPIDAVNRYQEYKRDRWLNDEELLRLSEVLDCYHNQSVANAIRLLILTGSRKGEVLRATWEQFDLEKGIWKKPAHTTKQKRMEHLPLSHQAIALLKSMKATATTLHLFPGKLPGEPTQDIKKAWKTICKRAELENTRIHDLRHTHASHLVSSGLSLSIVGKLLGHTQASTTQRYAHLADEPLRQAADLFGQKFDVLKRKELHNKEASKHES